jgi:hypothetical protein
MTQELLISVDNYVTDLFIPVDPASQEAIAFSENSGPPSIKVAPYEGKLLILLVQICRAFNLPRAPSCG